MKNGVTVTMDNWKRYKDLEAEVEKMELILENNLLCRKNDKKKIDELEAKLNRCRKKFYELYGDISFFNHNENDFFKFVEKEFPERFKNLGVFVEEIEKGE